MALMRFLAFNLEMVRRFFLTGKAIRAMTKQRQRSPMSVIGGKADMAGPVCMSANDPKRTFGRMVL